MASLGQWLRKRVFTISSLCGEAPDAGRQQVPSTHFSGYTQAGLQVLLSASGAGVVVSAGQDGAGSLAGTTAGTKSAGAHMLRVGAGRVTWRGQ